jgi:hypothetical protein
MERSLATLCCCLGMAAGACVGHKPAEAPILAALRSTAQPAIDDFTNTFVFAEGRFDRAWVRDWSPQHVYIPISEGPTMGRMHLGVDRIGDYFLCLLEVRFGTTTEAILAERKKPLSFACQQGSCGVCCSETYPFSDRARSILVSYWDRRRDEWAAR